MKMDLLVSFIKETRELNTVDFEEINVTEIDDTIFTVEIEGEDWDIVDEDTALERVENYVKETASYFTSSFLSEMTDLPEKVFEALQDENEAVVELIEKTCGISKFIEEAIRYDSMGHFLSSYDGEQYDLIDGYIAYRTN